MVDVLIGVSGAVAGREVAVWRLQEASIILAKACTTGLSAQKCNPLSKFYAPAGPYKLWDVSSYATLCRALVELYLNLHYIAAESVPDEEHEFRRFLWGHHREVERLKMVEEALPDSDALSDLRRTVDANRATIMAHGFYARLAQDRQKVARSGRDSKYLKNDEICVRAGMSKRYVSSMFKYLSNHTHTSPLSLAIMDIQFAGSPGARESFEFVSQILAQFCAMVVRDMIAICPDPKPILEGEIIAEIAEAEDMLKWEKSPAFAGKPLA